MSKELVISATPHETRVAILEEGQLCEIYVEREKEFALVGSIYKGRVTRVLPGMQSAFVDIGLDGDAFLYVSDFLEGIEDYDHIVSTVEEKVQKMEQQGGQVFAPASTAPPAEPAAAPPEPPLDEPPARTAPPISAPPERPRGYGRRDRGRERDRGGRWGRQRGGRGRPPRELPPSKFTRPAPYEPPPPVEPHEVVILPGESLAKYKDRIPAAPPVVPLEAAPEAVTPVAAEPESLPAEIAPPPGTRFDQEFREDAERETGRGGPGCPPAIEGFGDAHAGAPLPVPESQEPIASEETEASEPGAAGWAEAAEATVEPPAESAEPGAPADTELTADEATNLAEQVAEAQQEAAEAEAEAAEEAGLHESADAAPAEYFAEAEAEAGEPDAELPAETSEADAAEPAETQGPVERTARVHESRSARFQRPMRRGGRHRGGRFPRPAERRQPPRRHQSISELLKTGQEIIVQIAKEPLGKKGARITSHIALPGRFLVYMPTLDHIGVSRKIVSAEQRSRLRRLMLETKGSAAGGFIVRTAAEAASDDEIRTDVEFLLRTWSDIRNRAEQRKVPALLHRDLDLIERILRDHLSSDYTAIWVDNEEEFTKIVEFVGRFQPNLVSRVKLYTKDAPIFEEIGIQQEIDKALRPKVWLKSGGYIVINHTEALVAIDVNTGKFVGKGSTRLEDTIVKTNLEAVKEIVRQIRLRDLGGIIVVDFIDMEERKNRMKVMQALDEALRSDKAPSKVLAFNEFGLVAITRKRTKQALERVLCQPCPYCTGSGMVKSLATICYEIQTEARKMAPELDSQSLTLRVHPEIAKALKTRESGLIEELERWAHKSVIIQGDPSLHWEQYDIY